MRNRPIGLCYRCGRWVAPGKGHFERNAGTWRVQHFECCIAARDGAGNDNENRERIA